LRELTINDFRCGAVLRLRQLPKHIASEEISARSGRAHRREVDQGSPLFGQRPPCAVLGAVEAEEEKISLKEIVRGGGGLVDLWYLLRGASPRCRRVRARARFTASARGQSLGTLDASSGTACALRGAHTLGVHQSSPNFVHLFSPAMRSYRKKMRSDAHHSSIGSSYGARLGGMEAGGKDKSQSRLAPC
jgi:hypothetical protein